jgi:hypothetical protein
MTKGKNGKGSYISLKDFAITHPFTFVKVCISMIHPLNMTPKVLIFILKLVKTRGYDCNLNVI